MMRDIRNKTAVITGGASGIGLAMARCFAAEGAKLVLADVEENALHQAVAELASDGADVIGQRTDVTDPTALETLLEASIARFGRVHILCNNAGVSITGPTWEMGLDDWRWVWDVNVWGVVNGIKAFLPHMLAHGEDAHIVNTGSLASFNGMGDHAPYCASKAAVLSLSQSLFCEMKALVTNVGVTIVCPGMVATRIHESWRNRPDTDRPWSDRESVNNDFRAASAAFQGAGISPATVAQETLRAIQEDRFYSFSEPQWREYLDLSVGRALRAENPTVITWGEDLRPQEERAV